MSDFTGKDEYQKLFSPKAYLENFFQLGAGSMGDEYLQFVLKELAETFNSVVNRCQHGYSDRFVTMSPHTNHAAMYGKVKGDTLMDIGTGPCIYQLLSACEAFKNIIVSDFTDKNREELNVWLKNQPEAFDWSSVVRHVCHLEGDRITCQEKEEKLRKTIKQVLKCDVLKTNPIDPVTIPQVDCLLSCLCLEGACKDFESYVTALKNITEFLKPGGYLVLTGVLGNSYYQVGEVKFSALTLNEAFLRETLPGAGYVIENFQLSKKTENSLEDKADFIAYYVITAQKK